MVNIEHVVKERGSMTKQNFWTSIFGRVQLFEMTLSFALLHAGNQTGFVGNVKPIFLCRRMLFMPRMKWLAFARNCFFEELPAILPPVSVIVGNTFSKNKTTNICL